MADPLPNVDELFPAQPQSVDELFPADVERERYRRQTLGTSPIQDLIFGGTDVNPIARVLDHFGQGARQGWGAEPSGLSEESADALRKAGIFNDYDKGQRSIIKAMNESLFRGAAVALYDPLFRGLPAAFRGVQEAIAQTGEELGQPKLGREAAGALEAFPAGFRQPTGAPGAGVAQMGRAQQLGAVQRQAAIQTELAAMEAELARARDMGVIGSGEAGWKGTAEVPAPTVKQEAAAVKPEVLESGMHQPVEVAPGEVKPGVEAAVEPAAEVPAEPLAVAAGKPVDETHPIARDVARRLEHAGRPADEAIAAGQVVAAHYEARAARFGGELGTAEEMYEAEGAKIRGPNGEAPEPVAPPRPKIVLPGEGAKPENPNQSLLDFLAREGGLKPTPDLEQIFGGQNPTIPGAGRLFRKDGMTMDEALTKAKENSFILDPNDIQHVPGVENKGANTVRWHDLQDKIAEEAAGNKQYRNTRAAEPAKVNADEEYRHIADKLASEIEASGGSAADIDPVTERRVVEMVQKGEAPDVLSAYERAIMETEYYQKHGPQSTEFKKWFGESKVVDESGEPLVVYHGTNSEISAFEKSFLGKSTKSKSAKAGFFFTDNLETARGYARIANDRPVQDLIERSQAAERRGKWDEANRLMAQAEELEAKGARPEHIIDAYVAIKNPHFLDAQGQRFLDIETEIHDAIAQAKAAGNDGVIIKNLIDNADWGSDREATHYIVFEPTQIKSASANRGTFDPNNPRIFEQIKRGKIRFPENGRAVITLFKDANASTFIHETGHHWLEEMMKDAENPKAPASIRADADSVLKWLGVESRFDIKVRHHEQFARGFERYMMEGKAPSQGLAKVFAAFRDWLTRIYQTVDRLKSPINDEIRGVFDRLLAVKPEQVKIEPEAPKNFADIHEADALSTPPEAAHPVAETIRQERDRLAAEHIPEEHDARLEGIASEAARREAGGPQPVRDGNEAARPQEAGNDQATGAVGEGGGAVAPESAGPSAQPRTEVPLSAQEPFKAETPLVDKAGNIRIDNLSTPEDVSQVIRDAAIANNDFIDARRGVVTDGQVLELADALGMDEGTLNRRKLGEAFNAEQVMAARKLLIQSATRVRDAMAKAASGSEADILAYAEAKQRHRMIQEQVAGLTAEAGRALRAFRKLEGQQEAKQLDAFLKDATGKTLFQLQREAQLGMQLETPAQVSKFVNDTAKPSLKDMVIEAWMAALLSGPKTHLANILGNSISGLWRPLETLAASGVGKARSLVTGSQDRVLPGEAAAELFGMLQGSREGVVAAYKAYKTGEGQLTTTRQAEQYNPRALPSATVNLFGKERQIGGEQARIPLRMLTAEDEFFKSVAFRGDINRQAYAIAAKEGLPTEQLHARVAELSANPTDEMIANAKKVAEYQTFQTPLGNVGRSVQNFSNSHILAKLVVPFVRTPINLLKYAGERSPLGVFSREVRDNLSGKNGAVARDTQIARIALGTMVGVAATEMASQGLITGGGPADPKQKAIMRANGWQDYSVKIGDMYYRYNRLDPFSIILGVVADAWEINQTLGAKELDKQHLPALIFGAISKNVLERASLKGPSDLIQAVTDPERYGKGYIKGLVGTVVPALAAQSAQAMDPIVREARTVIDGLKARIPGLSQTLMPKRDVWGEPIVREGGLGLDIASPIAESRLKNDPVNKALIAANYFPGKLDRKIRGVELTDQQYDDYQRIAGRTAKVRLNAIVSMPGFAQMPESTRKELMTNAITNSRELARSLILMQNPDIIKKANDAKRAKLN